MSLAQSVAPTLGVATTRDGAPPRSEGEAYDLRFRREVSQMVHDLLYRHYVKDNASAREVAHKRGLTVEQLLAATIAHLVMKKVDEEYV
jgi:hypothetical protein